jgi:hypothetical protein
MVIKKTLEDTKDINRRKTHNTMVIKEKLEDTK